jgi:hypothetical protein
VYVINHRQKWQERLPLVWKGILAELGLATSPVEVREGQSK